MKKKYLCMVILFQNYIFYRFFLFVIAEDCIFCCCLIGAAVDSNDLTVFSPSHCQVTKLHFPPLYKFLVLIDK